MQAPGRYFNPSIRLHNTTQDLPKKDFVGALFTTGKQKCYEYLGKDLMDNVDNLNLCRNEVMVASSCVLLNKANYIMGDLRDNVGLCKFEIKYSKKILKERFESFPEDKFDKWLTSLSLSTKSFV